jgi:hypothetical protein
MNNQLQKKLTEALENKENDISLYVWKGPKVDMNGTRVQESIKLVDATPEQLQEFYNHCQSMLYSTDRDNPGRLVLLDIIKDQRERCNTELYLRYVENAYLSDNRPKIQRFTYLNSIKTFMDNNKELFPREKLGEILITSVTGGVPDDFKSLTIDYVLDGLLDKLGVLSKKHLTLSFLLKLGLWFTPQEKREFDEEVEQTGKTVSEIIKERCGLKANTKLRIIPKGLFNYKEFRAMITLKNKKYSEMTTDQLLTLRNKVLFALEDEVEFHAKSWVEREKQILKVAESRGIELDT